MSLCLTITSYHKITPGQCSEKSMNQGSMAIGRSSDNDWVLPDPERLVSSQHCVIQYKDGRYYLTDNSTNGVELVNAGIRLRRGNSELLQDGELIRIGDYEIQARIDFNVQAIDSQPFAGDSPNSFEALMGAVANKPAPTPVIAPQFQGASSMDTLPDLFDFLSPTAVPPPTVADHVPSEQHDFRPPTPVAVPVVETPVVSGSVIPEDWDLFGDTPAPSASAPPPPPPPPTPIIQPPPVVEPVLPVAATHRGRPCSQRTTRLPPADAGRRARGRDARGLGLGDSRRLGPVWRHASARCECSAAAPTTDHPAATCGRACAPRCR